MPTQASLNAMLVLERIDRDLYRTPVAADSGGRLFGGLIAAQALAAAGEAVPKERVPHSLHGYFLRGGDAASPTVLRVERDRDGRSFSARRVVALQDGQVNFNLSASFQLPGPGGAVPAGLAATLTLTVPLEIVTTMLCRRAGAAMR